MQDAQQTEAWRRLVSGTLGVEVLVGSVPDGLPFRIDVPPQGTLVGTVRHSRRRSGPPSQGALAVEHTFMVEAPMSARDLVAYYLSLFEAQGFREPPLPDAMSHMPPPISNSLRHDEWGTVVVRGTNLHDGAARVTIEWYPTTTPLGSREDPFAGISDLRPPPGERLVGAGGSAGGNVSMYGWTIRASTTVPDLHDYMAQQLEPKGLVRRSGRGDGRDRLVAMGIGGR